MPELVTRTRKQEIRASIYCYMENDSVNQEGSQSKYANQNLCKKLGTCLKPIEIKKPQEY